mgnify:CR=1 FL=1
MNQAEINLLYSRLIQTKEDVHNIIELLDSYMNWLEYFSAYTKTLEKRITALEERR